MAHLYQTFLNQTNLLPHNRRQRGQHCRQGRKKSSFLLPFSNIGAYQRVLFWHFSVIEGCSRIVKLSAITFKKNVMLSTFFFYFLSIPRIGEKHPVECTTAVRTSQLAIVLLACASITLNIIFVSQNHLAACSMKQLLIL